MQFYENKGVSIEESVFFRRFFLYPLPRISYPAPMIRFIRSLAILLVITVAACTPSRELEHAPQGDNFIVLWHKPSNERIAVTYRSGGQYLPDAFEQIDRIFRDRHNGDTYPVDPALIDIIAGLRDRLVMPRDAPIELLSGYRSPETNGELSKTNKYVARNSYHMKGQAADIRMPEMNSRALEAVAKTLQRGGVALYPDSQHVHVDTGPIRSWAVIRGKEAGLRPSAKNQAASAYKAPVRKYGTMPGAVKTGESQGTTVLGPPVPAGVAPPPAPRVQDKPKGFVKQPWKPSASPAAKPAPKATGKAATRPKKAPAKAAPKAKAKPAAKKAPAKKKPAQ
jgi:uncharacterized protein YcbK (DUF882 family)